MSLEHWHYFLTLESDLERTLRYVEPDPPNYNTYSVEFVRLLLSTCSEIDVVSKVLCQEVDPGSAPKNIDDYRQILSSKFPKLHTMQVHAARLGKLVTPWKDWASAANPSWWREHNQVKHSRHEHFAKANLINCIVSASGLYCLLLYLYRDQLLAHALSPRSNFFRLPKEPRPLVDGLYELPDFPAPT